MSPLPFFNLALPSRRIKVLSINTMSIDTNVSIYTKILPSLRTALNKLDKRISSLLPFPITLLIDSVKRNTH